MAVPMNMLLPPCARLHVALLTVLSCGFVSVRAQGYYETESETVGNFHEGVYQRDVSPDKPISGIRCYMLKNGPMTGLQLTYGRSIYGELYGSNVTPGSYLSIYRVPSDHRINRVVIHYKQGRGLHDRIRGIQFFFKDVCDEKQFIPPFECGMYEKDLSWRSLEKLDCVMRYISGADSLLDSYIYRLRIHWLCRTPVEENDASVRQSHPYLFSLILFLARVRFFGKI